jgi:hypothetical protein
MLRCDAQAAHRITAYLRILHSALCYGEMQWPHCIPSVRSRCHNQSVFMEDEMRWARYLASAMIYRTARSTGRE